MFAAVTVDALLDLRLALLVVPSDDVEATILDIYVKTLYNTVADHRNRRTPHLEYAAEVTLTD